MKKCLEIAVFALLVLASAVGLKSITTHGALTNGSLMAAVGAPVPRAVGAPVPRAVGAPVPR
jgi:hypothetical protein